MYLISSRKNFWENNIISEPTDRVGEVNLDTMDMKPRTMANYESLITDKKVLLLCHGYNNEPEDVIRAYQIIENNQLAHLGYFDVVVGYTWPGGDDWTDYRAAKNRASAVAGRFAKLLQITIPKCPALGVMSHSMGCRISLIAHELLHNRGIAKCNKLWQFLMAAAVDNESVEAGERYFDATLYDDNTYVFHSKKDEVLLSYVLIEWDRALGYSGPENVADIHSTTKIVNCKHVVKSHGDYKRTQQVYNYIRNEMTGVPAPQFSTLR